jgi:hypothetical protein
LISTLHATMGSSAARGSTLSRVAGVLGACSLVALAASCSRPSEAPIPAEPKARSDFVGAAAAKLGPDEQRLLARFIARLESRESNGTRGDPNSTITVSRAVDLQRSYESQVSRTQSQLKEKLGAAQGAVRVEIKDPQVVRQDRAKAGGERALRFVVNVNNRSTKTVDRIALRVEIRESSGKYQAAIPNLQLGGPLRPGETGRSTQMLALDPQRHQYILDGKPLQINAFPVQVVYQDGEKIDPGSELDALGSLHSAKIE